MGGQTKIIIIVEGVMTKIKFNLIASSLTISEVDWLCRVISEDYFILESMVNDKMGLVIINDLELKYPAIVNKHGNIILSFRFL